MIQQIENIADVIIFSRELLAEGTNFHPDDDFNDYINSGTGESVYTEEAATLRNELMKQCFVVCIREGVDLYDLTHDIYLKETGLDKLIPLSTDPI